MLLGSLKEVRVIFSRIQKISPVAGACSCSEGRAWHSLGGRDGLEGGQQVLRLEWMEVEVVVAAGKSAERLVDAMESLACGKEHGK